MKAWAGLALVLALEVAGCQRTQTPPSQGTGGGGGPTAAPSPLASPRTPEFLSGPTGGVGKRLGGSMGGMDTSGIGPGSPPASGGGGGGGGGSPQAYPTPGPLGADNGIVAPINDPTLMKQEGGTGPS